MGKIDVVMPQLGESLTEGTIIKWHKKPGDKIKKDETLLEISTDKVDSEIPSPASGVVTKILFKEQTTIPVRETIAEIDTDESAAVSKDGPKGAAPSAPAQPAPAASAPAAKSGGAPAGSEAPAAKSAPSTSAPAPTSAPQAPPARQTAAASSAGRFYSPLVLNIAQQEGIAMAELETIPGTGEGGRVSKKDILAYVAARKSGQVAPAPAAAPAGFARPAAHAAPAAPRIESVLKTVDGGELAKKYPAPGHEIRQMSNLLVKMSEHMVRSVHTSPHVYAMHEVDMTAVEKVRARNSGEFARREGFSSPTRRSSATRSSGRSRNSPS
jgi:2-oxoglutarate dehydrogenase E2 component (dihydrolipoamide succinyltransferase)